MSLINDALKQARSQMPQPGQSTPPPMPLSTMPVPPAAPETRMPMPGSTMPLPPTATATPAFARPAAPPPDSGNKIFVVFAIFILMLFLGVGGGLAFYILHFKGKVARGPAPQPAPAAVTPATTPDVAGGPKLARDPVSTYGKAYKAGADAARAVAALHQEGSNAADDIAGTPAAARPTTAGGAKPPAPAPDTLKLQGIMSSGAERLALINGRITHQGDRIEDFIVARIDSTTVLLKRGTEDFTLTIPGTGP